MKRVCAVFCALIFAAISGLFSYAFAGDEKIRVVATVFPIYDWIREIVGENSDHVEIGLLLDSGVDLHSYQPSAQDILKISTAGLFVYVGGESDAWVEAVSLVKAMGENIKAEEIVEGMEQEHEHDDSHGRERAEEEEKEADEHVWLSLRNARYLVTVIADTLAGLDPDHAAGYRANAASYAEKLDALDKAYAAVVESAAYKTILFGDRFPFRYLADDYGLNYYAAFSGCSAESEASFATILFLAQKVDELHLPAVLTIGYPKTRIAETVVASTSSKDQKILAMDSMQGTTSQDIRDGVTYLAVMEKNLQVLAEALN